MGPGWPGLSFDCPTCGLHRIEIPFREHGQGGWARHGQFPNLSLVPSICVFDKLRWENGVEKWVRHWQGWIVKGQVRTTRTYPYDLSG